ncbi:hypothetical protein, conserved [Eimeria acervulina]|uniref:Uncharacterized protein n=1 Tax=Eimeria acervulina TaxID=5801 RepID=U6GAN2_EIMAC|nr:hypothetical protein, conserved [Eimeria acervulina]CDI77190.1 hypothetical protein, conserved [Eimeria acervulina]
MRTWRCRLPLSCIVNALLWRFDSLDWHFDTHAQKCSVMPMGRVWKLCIAIIHQASPRKETTRCLPITAFVKMKPRKPGTSETRRSSSNPHTHQGDLQRTGTLNSRSNSPAPARRQDSSDSTPPWTPAGQQRGLPPLPRTQHVGSATAFAPERFRHSNSNRPNIPERLRNVNFDPAQSSSQPSQPPSRKNSFQPNQARLEVHQDYPASPFQLYSPDEQQDDSQQQEFLASLEYPAWQPFEKGEPYDCIEQARKQLENSIPQRPSGLGQIPGHGIGQVPSHDAGPDSRQVSSQLPEPIQRSNSSNVPGYGYDQASDQGTDEIRCTSSQDAVHGSDEILNRSSSHVQSQVTAQVLRRSSSQATGHSWGPVPGHGIGQAPAQPAAQPSSHGGAEVIGHGPRQLSNRGVSTDPLDETIYPRQRFYLPYDPFQMRSYQMQHTRAYPPQINDQHHFQGPRPQHGLQYRRGHHYQSYRIHHHFPQQYWRPTFVAPFHRVPTQPPPRPPNRRAFQFDCTTPAFVPQFPGNRQLELDILAQASTTTG